MAEFEAKVYKLTIEEHPNADVLEIARVGDYLSIVGKGTYKTGDLAVYIPEQAILPDWIIEKLGLVGRLAGKAKNRVKAIKLRGVLSQGLIYPLEYLEKVRATNTENFAEEYADIWVMDRGCEVGSKLRVEEGDSVTEFLNIEKYEPIIPASMSGELVSGFGYTLKYDIENIKKYPDIFEEGEPIVVTEKLHGTWACFGWHPECTATDGYVVASKGLSSQGKIFKMNEKNAEKNLYVRTMTGAVDWASEKMNIIDYVRQYVNDNFAFNENRLPYYILGEIFGRGVQDLHYGQQHAAFRVFDIYVGDPDSGRYLDHAEKHRMCTELNLPRVPEMYIGKYSKEKIEQLTNGTTVVNSGDGTGAHMREGVVINPLAERRSDEIGRVILKSVSEDYLLRKNGTEYN